MSIFLTNKELRLVEDHAPRPDMVAREPGYPEEVAVLKEMAIRWGGDFAEDQAEEFARIITKWVGLFPKKPSQAVTFNASDYLDCIFGLCERSALPVLILKNFLESLLISSRTLPSICEISERLDELKFAGCEQSEAAHKAEISYAAAAKQLAAAVEIAHPQIRKEIPAFPAVNELQDAWRRVWKTGLGNAGSPTLNERRVADLVGALEADETWPAILLYLFWLVSKLPEDKMGIAASLHQEIYQDEIAASLHQEIYQDEEGEGQHMSPSIMLQVLEDLPNYKVEDECDPLDGWLLEMFEMLNAKLISDIKVMWRRESLHSDPRPDGSLMRVRSRRRART